MARRPSRRSEGQDHRRVVQDAGRVAAAEGRLSRRPYSGRGVLRRRRGRPIIPIRCRTCIRTPSNSARCRCARHFHGDTVVAYDSGGWVAAPRAWWMFLSFGHPNVQGAGRRPEEMDGRRPPGRVRRGHAEAREVPGQARSGLRPQQAATARQSRDAGRAGGRRAAACAFRGHALPSRGRVAVPATSPAAATCPTPNCSMPRPAR